MDSNFSDKIRDCLFVSAEDINAEKDYILLRLSIEREGVKVDAIVRLDVQCYVHPLDGSSLFEILSDSEITPPKRFSEWKKLLATIWSSLRD